MHRDLRLRGPTPAALAPRQMGDAMKNTFEMEKILERGVSGFHIYALADPVHLCYVSRNFCALTGYSEEELLSESAAEVYLFSVRTFWKGKERWNMN